MFRMLDMVFGPHDVDRFASYRTQLLPTYNSFFVDLVRREWMRLSGLDRNEQFCKSTIFLLGKVVKKVVNQRVTVTIIAPLWKNQWWFKLLREHLVCPPIRIQNVKAMFQGCLTVPEPLKNVSWKIYAWKVCGKARSEQKVGMTRPTQRIVFNWAPTTLECYSRHVTKFVKFVDQKGVDRLDVSSDIIAEYFVDIAEKSSRPKSMLDVNSAAIACYYGALD